MANKRLTLEQSDVWRLLSKQQEAVAKLKRQRAALYRKLTSKNGQATVADAAAKLSVLHSLMVPEMLLLEKLEEAYNG